VKKLLLSLAAAATVTNVSTAAARDSISIVGSSTVYPFATVVAERFGKSTDFRAPKVESTGSGGGLKLFCKGVGVATPDITNASRRILAKLVPGPDGKLIENPNKTWKDVNAALPATKIEVLGPPPTSGTRDAFVELALEGGAKKVADIKALRKMKANQVDEIKAMVGKLGIEAAWAAAVEKKGAKAKGKDVVKIIGRSVREDGAYIEAGENDNLIVNKLVANPNALGIFGFSFLDQNSDKVQGSIIDGNAPTFEAIASGDYKVSRPLYFYVKKAHIGTVPGIQEYLNTFVSEDTIGPDGYLVDKGLIPLGDEQYLEMSGGAKALNNLAL